MNLHDLCSCFEQSGPLETVDLKLQSYPLGHSELGAVDKVYAARSKSSADGGSISVQSMDCPGVLEVFDPIIHFGQTLRPLQHLSIILIAFNVDLNVVKLHCQ